MRYQLRQTLSSITFLLLIGKIRHSVRWLSVPAVTLWKHVFFCIYILNIFKRYTYLEIPTPLVFATPQKGITRGATFDPVIKAFDEQIIKKCSRHTSDAVRLYKRPSIELEVWDNDRNSSFVKSESTRQQNRRVSRSICHLKSNQLKY